MSGTIRVSEFHRLMTERGIGQAAEIAKERTQWSTTVSSGNTRSNATYSGERERSTEESSSKLGFELFANNRGGSMRGSRGALFAQTLEQLNEEKKEESESVVEEKEGWSRGGRRDNRGAHDNRDLRDSRESRGYGRNNEGRRVGTGTWSLEDLNSNRREYVHTRQEPEVVKPKIPGQNEFPELQMGVKESKEEGKKTVVWGSKKEIIETIKSSTMDEINDESKRRRKVEKYNEYIESQEVSNIEYMEKKKKDWISRLKKQHSKDYNYRHIDDILKEEEQYMAVDELDPMYILEEQMLYDGSYRQTRIEQYDDMDYEWYYKETQLLMLSEWSKEGNIESIEKIEERVWRNDIM